MHSGATSATSRDMAVQYLSYEVLSLFLSLLAATTALVALVRGRKVAQANADFQQRQEHRANDEEVSRYLLARTQYQVVVRSLMSRTRAWTTEKDRLVHLLSALNVPEGKRHKAEKHLEDMGKELTAKMESIEQAFRPVFQDSEQVESTIWSILDSGAPLPEKLLTALRVGSSKAERQAFDLGRRADEVFEPREKYLALLREELARQRDYLRHHPTGR